MMFYWLVLYAALPAFAANMIPVLADRWNWFPLLDKPLDGGKMFRGRRIFGAHKTWRGLIFGALIGILVGAVSGWLYFSGKLIYFFQFESYQDFLLFGFLSGFGALLGDALKSFLKRQIGIESGRPFLVFDQIDYILGMWLCTSLLVSWDLISMGFLIGFALVVNPLVNGLSYLLGIKKTFW